jgi:Na+-translocating ferredoxin:NAD+ oxidoreductase RNF subunit RnfB
MQATDSAPAKFCIPGGRVFSREIAARLSISPRTVEFHKYQMMEMHELQHCRLIHFAIKHGVVSIWCDKCTIVNAIFRP